MSEQQNPLRFDVFISYRRDGGEVLGRLLFELLKSHYDVFFDHESLSSGRFDTKLLSIIENCADVLVILSKGCLDRCGNEGDWFMQEICHAQDTGKNIILLMTEDFYMPTPAELPSYHEKLQSLLKYNGYRISIAYIDSIIGKLEVDLHTKKKKTASPFDSLSEWRTFARCLSDKRFSDFLPKDIKHAVLHGAINNFLDEYSAKILSSQLSRMEEGACNVRTKYRYEIDISEEFDFRVLDIDPEKYYSLSEAFSYSKKFMAGAPDRSFWLSFATNLDELDDALRNENFFFSENLMIDPEDVRALTALDADDKEEFYRSAMRARININGKVLSPLEIRIDESGIFAKYEFDEELLASSDTFDVKIRFRIPQKGGDSYFFASINDPSYSPFIRFSYPEEDFDVQMIPFLNRSVTAKDTKIFEGLRELSVEDEWVLPVSGAIFIITKT